MSWSFKQDPDKAKGKGFELLPQGEYEAFITGYERKQSQSSAYDYFNVTLTIRDDVEGQEDFKGRKVWDVVSLSPNAEFKFHQYGEAVMMPKGTEFESPEEFMEYIKARSVAVHIAVESYTNRNGEQAERNAVKLVAPSRYGGFYKPPAEDTEVISADDEDFPF